MADVGIVETELAGMADKDTKRILKRVFEYVLTDIRLGRPEDGERAKNFPGGFYDATTPTTPGNEFIVAHDFGRPPYLLIPVLPVGVVGATLVPLTVTRAADATNIYLSSSEADAAVTVYLEG